MRPLGGGDGREYAWPGRIRQVGVENLRCESAFDPANPHDEEHAWGAIGLENAQDAWVRQVTSAHFAGSAVAVWESCKRVTVEDCTVARARLRDRRLSAAHVLHQRAADALPPLPRRARPARLRRRLPGGRAERLRPVQGDERPSASAARSKAGRSGVLYDNVDDRRRRPGADQPRDRRPGRRLGGGQLRPLAMHRARRHLPHAADRAELGHRLLGRSSSATATGGR